MSIRYAPRTWRLIEQGVPDTLTQQDLPEHARQLTEALFGPGSWRSTIWSSIYRKHERMASRFRQGRVVLVGDAAHLNSPAGGQGLNTGVRDAHNLAWKLDAFLSGQGDEEALLSSYESEQQDAFRNEVGPLTDLAERLQTSPQWVRKIAFRSLWLGRAFGLKEQAAAKHSMLFTEYGASSLLFDVGHLVGRRMPDTQLPEGRLHDVIGRWGMILYRPGEADALRAEELAKSLDCSAAPLPRALDESGFATVAFLYVRPDAVIGLQVPIGERLDAARLRAATGFRPSGSAEMTAARLPVRPST